MKPAGGSEELARVNRQHPCPICGHTDWCTYTSKYAVCMRVQSDKEAKNGGWVHYFDKGVKVDYTPPPPKETVAPVEIAIRHRFYTALLRDLLLSKAHLDNLRKRGLSDEAIKNGEYKTLTDRGRAQIVKAVIKNTGIEKGIPGLFWKQGKFGVYRTLAGAPGLLIPVRDLDGRIQGMQIRVDNPGDGAKYRWVSSADRNGGTASGAPVHVAKPNRCNTNQVWVTEGPLKADVASHKLGAMFLGVAGVGNWKEVPDILSHIKPNLVMLAYDADLVTNPAVLKHKDDLEKALRERGFSVANVVWDIADGKGIDDLLLKGGKYWTIRGQ